MTSSAGAEREPMTKNLIRRAIFPSLIAGVAALFAGCATPGVSAAVRRDPDRLQKILDQPNHGNERLEDLMTNAVAFDCAECVRRLLQAGAKPDPKYLSAAALAERAEIAGVLIDAGAEPAAAMAVVHGDMRKWAGGAGLSKAQAQSASDFLRKLERERASRSGAPVPAPAPAAPAAAAPEPPSSREAPLFKEAERPDDYALVVGIERYDELPAAAYAERDAAAAAAFVKALGVPARNVVTLTGAHATRSGLAKRLEGWLAENVVENSTVYVYYAGLDAPDSKSGLAYLVPFDGDPKYLDQTAYPLKRMYEKLGALKAKRVIVMLDSGFSGTGGRSVSAKGEPPPASGAETGFNSADGRIALLAAADAAQTAGMNEEKGYGLFTYYLLDGLNGGAMDASGRVTLKSLFDYVKPKVAGDARRANRDQVPQFESGGSATDHVVLRTK